MRQVRPYRVFDGSVLKLNFPAHFCGVYLKDSGIHVYVLIDTDEQITREFKIHAPPTLTETEVRAEWYIGSDRGVSVFAERLK